MFKRTLTLGYGVLAYTLFFAVFNYAIMFIGNIMVSPSLDSIGNSDTGLALLIDIALLTAFALQHSVMARPAFKRAWTKLIPEPVERSTYVLASTLMLGCIVYFWQPLGGVLWRVTDPLAVGILYSRLGHTVSGLIPDQSLRPVRSASGVAVFSRQALYTTGVQNPLAVPPHAPPPVCRPHDRPVGSANHDRRAPGLCPAVHRLYLRWYKTGGERPGKCPAGVQTV